MEYSIRILIDVVITRACPIPITVDQCCIGCKKPKRTINIEYVFQLFFEFFWCRFIQSFAQLNQALPGLFLIFGLDLKTFTIRRDIITQIPESTITSWASVHFPACSTGCSIIRFNKVTVELFDVAIHSPAFTVDHNIHKVGFRRWNPRAGNL